MDADGFDCYASNANVWPFVGQRQYLHFPVTAQTLSIGPVAGIKPANLRSRRLEVAGTRKNGRTRDPSRVSLARAPSLFRPVLPSACSLRGRRLKGKGKGVLCARETRGAPSSRAPPVSLAPKNLFPLPFKRLARGLKRLLRRLQTRNLPLCSEALYGQHELINPKDDSKIDID